MDLENRTIKWRPPTSHLSFMWPHEDENAWPHPPVYYSRANKLIIKKVWSLRCDVTPCSFGTLKMEAAESPEASVHYTTPHYTTPRARWYKFSILFGAHLQIILRHSAKRSFNANTNTPRASLFHISPHETFQKHAQDALHLYAQIRQTRLSAVTLPRAC